MKTFLFSLCHPAHFHMFKHTIRSLTKKGHKVVVVIRPKDVLEQLCIDEGLPYKKIEVGVDKSDKTSKMVLVLRRTKAIARVVKAEKPCMLIGSDGVMAYLGSLFHIPSFEFFDDDYEVIRLYAWAFFPFYSDLVCPNITNAAYWTKKKTGYEGYQKLAYLHPNWFNPDKNVVEKYFSTGKPYFIVRFAKLIAHHDGGIGGISTKIAHKLISILLPYGDVYITSERDLEPEFEQYRLNISPSHMHHVLAYANLYIGDSQSMAVEAAMLGTPSLRFNDFAGKIRVLEELEHRYELTYAFPSSEPQKLYDKVEELLSFQNLRETFQLRRQKMLSEKIDVTAFFIWFIENYPESKKVMRESPDYQWKFR